MASNKQIVEKFFEELWNQRKLEVADSIFAGDCHTHQLQSGAPVSPAPRGPEAVKRHVNEWLAGFPDLHFTIDQMLVEGDRVMSQVAMDGSHTGHWLGIPPTGKRVNIRMMTIHRVQDSKIIEDWVLVESLGFLQELGALPATSDLLAEFVRRVTAASTLKDKP